VAEAEETISVRQKGRPKREQVAEIDLAIREAAINALLEHGEAATLNSVAAAAGLSRKSVYARYSSKSDLFQDVIRRLLEDGHAVEFNAIGSIEDRLRSYIRIALGLTSTREARAIHRLLNIDPSSITALKSDMQNATQKHFFVPLRKLLLDAQSTGELVMDDIDRATRAIVALIFAESMAPDRDIQSQPIPEMQDSYAQFVTTMVLKGLLPRREARKNG
jgi:TetR/AcrR family transcriptional regulator, mexJK operon transcriptional repressor